LPELFDLNPSLSSGDPLAIEASQQESNDHLEHEHRLSIFTDRLFERLPSDLSEDYPDHLRQKIAESAFEFFQSRAEPLKIRVRAGDESDPCVVETAMADRPFIVDSILEFFRKYEIPVRVLLHPIFQVVRDTEGALVSFEQATAVERAESFTHIEIELAPDTLTPAGVEHGLGEVLNELIDAVGDFDAMTKRALEICEETAATRSLVEIRDLLRWLIHDGFVFLGYRRYRVITHDGKPSLIVV
jgi:NAD-specific glutamate dehydrogenase